MWKALFNCMVFNFSLLPNSICKKIFCRIQMFMGPIESSLSFIKKEMTLKARLMDLAHLYFGVKLNQVILVFMENVFEHSTAYITMKKLSSLNQIKIQE